MKADRRLPVVSQALRGGPLDIPVTSRLADLDRRYRRRLGPKTAAAFMAIEKHDSSFLPAGCACRDFERMSVTARLEVRATTLHFQRSTPTASDLKADSMNTAPKRHFHHADSGSMPWKAVLVRRSFLFLADSSCVRLFHTSALLTREHTLHDLAFSAGLYAERKKAFMLGGLFCCC